MYVIIVYDVDISRVNKINKFLKRYLYWRQNSVFEGSVSNSQLEEIKFWIKKNLKKIDKVIIYKIPSRKGIEVMEFGELEKIENIL